MAQKLALLIVVLLTSVFLFAAAQQSSTPTPQQKSRAVESTPNSGSLNMTGCLQSNRGFATFTRQGTSQAFILLGDSAELSRNSGHQVRVQGTQLPPDGSQPPRDLPRLQVRSIETVGSDCAVNTTPESGPRPETRVQQGSAVETSPYSDPGSMSTSPAPVGPGTGQQINGRAEGAHSPGSGDPRNLSPSPQDVPVTPAQPDTGKTTKSGKKKNSSKDQDKNPPQQ